MFKELFYFLCGSIAILAMLTLSTLGCYYSPPKTDAELMDWVSQNVTLKTGFGYVLESKSGHAIEFNEDQGDRKWTATANLGQAPNIDSLELFINGTQNGCPCSFEVWDRSTESYVRSFDKCRYGKAKTILDTLEIYTTEDILFIEGVFTGRMFSESGLRDGLKTDVVKSVANLTAKHSNEAIYGLEIKGI